MNFLKSFFSLFLTFTLVLSTSGTGVFKHYCGGRLATVSLFLPYNPCNMADDHEGCNDEIPSDCCKDQQNYYKVDADFSASSSENQVKKIEILTGVIPVNWSENFTIVQKDFSSFERGPPADNRPEPYLLYQRLLLYS